MKLGDTLFNGAADGAGGILKAGKDLAVDTASTVVSTAMSAFANMWKAAFGAETGMFVDPVADAGSKLTHAAGSALKSATNAPVDGLVAVAKSGNEMLGNLTSPTGPGKGPANNNDLGVC